MFSILTALVVFFSGADEVNSQDLAAKAFSQTSSVVETLIDQVNPLLLVEDDHGNGG